jgi:hypothetical protein
MGSDGKRWEAMGSDGKRWEAPGEKPPRPRGFFARAIQLVVEDAGDGKRGDLADWAKAGFTTKE